MHILIRATSVGCAALTISFSSLGAQTTQPVPKKPVRPAYTSLRFDELWTPEQRTGRWDDIIKAIPLVPSSAVTLTMAGQARWREESVRAFNLSDANDTHSQSRTQLSADLRITAPNSSLARSTQGTLSRLHARVFAEVRDAQSYGRTLPGGTRPSDADRHDVQNLFADVGFGTSWVRYGRQEIALNRERLFGVPDWANTRRGLEGTRVQLVRSGYVVEAIDAYPVVVRQDAPNRADASTRFRTVSFGTGAIRPGTAAPSHKVVPNFWQGYWYEQTLHTPSTRTQRLTTGGRAMWQWSSLATPHVYSLEFEGATQSGHTSAIDIRAWFWVTEGAVQWKRTRGAPSIAIGIEEASGDRAGTTTRNEAFVALYPAAHAHGGFADVVGRANARELHLISTWAPFATVDVRGAIYRFDRLSLADGVYTKGNTLFRAANGSRARHAADEIDLTGTWKASRHWRVIAGGAVVMPGPFLRTTPGGANRERWGFVGSAFTF